MQLVKNMSAQNKWLITIWRVNYEKLQALNHVTWWKNKYHAKYKWLTVFSLLFLCLALIFLISVTIWVYKVWGDRGHFLISNLYNKSYSENRIALQNSQTFRKSLSWQRSSSKKSPRRLVGLSRSLFLKRMRALQKVWKKVFI